MGSISQLSDIIYIILLFWQIVWDLPRISRGVKSLDKSVIAFAYKEVAPPVTAFGNLVAQCFETQAVIALVNCTLTTLGLYWLKVCTILYSFFSFCFTKVLSLTD